MGQIREIVPDGSRVTAYNGTGSTIAVGYGVRRSGATDDQCALPAAITSLGWGVVVESMPTLKRGTIQTTGRVRAVAGAAIAVGAKVECGVDGKFVTHTTGTIWGIANTLTSADLEEFELELGIAAKAVS